MSQPVRRSPARLARPPWLLVIALLLPSGCQDDFESDVVPVLERRCANARCHGSPEPADSHDARRYLSFEIDSAGRIVDVAQALASVKSKINSTDDPALSSFLRKTLPVAAGGQPHFMGKVFRSRSDPEYQTLARWVQTIAGGTEGSKEPPLTALEQRFATEVYPTLVKRGCTTASCHGSLMFGGARIHAPPLPDSFALSRHELRETYLELQRNITLWGDPMGSRLIAKVLPVEHGGIPHKGGNDVFFAAELAGGKAPAEAEAIQAILGWIAAERSAALGPDAPPAPVGPPGLPSSVSEGSAAFPTLVAVGGPLPAAGPFAVQPFTPGSDLYRLDPTSDPATPVKVSNLTGGAHVGPADIRDPAISHDGRTLVFAMRRSEADATHIYTVGIDGAGLKQLTFDKQPATGGRPVGNFNPIFGPNGGFVAPDGKRPAERIYYSASRGDLADGDGVQNADLYVMDVDGAHRERLTFTPVPEVQPSFLSSGEFSGTMAYTIKRSADGGYKGVLFRFPICHNPAHHIQPEAHPHFGMSEPQQVFYGLRELPDGRAALVLFDEGNVWRGGQLALLERQFAVELEDHQVAQASVPNFRHALSLLGPDAARAGPSPGGLWRDPTPLPDGSLVVAHAEGPLDLDDPTEAPRTRLLWLALEADRHTHRARVKESRVLLDTPGLAWSQPVAAVARPTEDPPHERAWNHEDATASLIHSGVQVIEALLARLPPSGARVLRNDIAYVRALSPVSAAGAVDRSAVPPEQTRHGHQGANKASLVDRAPLFAVMEAPPAHDGSLAAAIPAKVPLRLSTLDADRMAVGAAHHHWYAMMPGERFPVGIPPAIYGARCGGCHGAMSGDKAEVLQPQTDFITQASVTASRFANADRRQPKTLPIIDSAWFVFVDFRRDVQPILDARCATVSCHSGAAPKAGLSLTGQPTAHYSDAYESLLAPGTGSAGGFAYVDALGHRARRSHLAERLLGRELDAPGVVTQPCPPTGHPQLTSDERLTILRWIELGAAFVGLPQSPP